MLHSGGEPVEVFLVQHVAQPGEALSPEQQQQQQAAAAQQKAEVMAMEQQHQQQQPYVQEAPGLSMHPHLQQQQQQQMAAAAAAAAAAGGHCGPDLTMEPPGLPAAATVASAAAAAAAAAAGADRAGPEAALAAAGRHPSSVSPISLLAKAIGAGGVSANDIPVPPPAGAAALVKQEPGSHPAPVVQPVAGLNSPVFPPPGSLNSPGLMGGASPAQQVGKWSEIDPEAWFEGDGSALGALGDFFKNDSSIFQATAADQHDSDLVTAW